MKKKSLLQQIRERHLVPARKGVRVEYTARCDGEEMRGVIVGAALVDKHRDDAILVLRVRLDGDTKAQNFHPTYRLRYLVFDEERTEFLLRCIDRLRTAGQRVLATNNLARYAPARVEAVNELEHEITRSPVSGFENEDDEI